MNCLRQGSPALNSRSSIGVATIENGDDTTMVGMLTMTMVNRKFSCT